MPSPIHRREALRRIAVMLGGTVSAPVVAGVLGGCGTREHGAVAAFATAPELPYAYQILDAHQQRLIAALVDQIIPATDTPGAAEAGVPEFIDLMLAEWYDPEDRAAFLAGLAEADARAASGGAASAGATGAVSFLDLDAEAQLAYVAALDAATFGDAPAPVTDNADEDVVESGQEGMYKAGEEDEREVAGMQGDLGEAQDENEEPGVDELGRAVDKAPATATEDGPSFYRQLKELTLAGYYTSEVGATDELRYNAVMGRYDPDVPVSEIGRAWA